MQDSMSMERVKSLAWSGFVPTFGEDCLYLNIYSPGKFISSTASPTYPVMVYIHGGGYQGGTALLYPGDILASRGVIVVTIQYRLGPFGFLTTGDAAARGNYGMLDQIQALRWIKENIHSFNGNPSQITIFGQSAGAFSVGLLLLSSLSKGLFHRAIALSGVELSYASTQPVNHGAYYTKLLAKALGCDIKDTKRMVECLREQDAVELSNVAMPYRLQGQTELPFAPVVDNHFLHAEPLELRKAGLFHRVKFIAGITDGEGSEIVKMDLQYLNFSAIDKGVPRTVFDKYIRTGIDRIIPSIKQPVRKLVAEALNFQYTPWPEERDPLKLRQALVHLVGDFNYGASTVHALSLHSHFAPAYMFEFRHVSKQRSKPRWMGAIHGDLADHTFGFPYINNGMTVPRFYDDEDRRVSNLTMTLFANFAKYDDPTYKPVLGATWAQLKDNKTIYFCIQTEPKMSTNNFRPSKVAFWNFHFPTLINTSLQWQVSGTAPYYVGCSTILLTLTSAFMCTSVLNVLVQLHGY